ncbi:MAG: hypothetical protein QGG36_13405 [Pirellulaceae bacterium]|jgi:hypothetical protein|nr:hypothetical protein [Pirellulaceae bacterium]MDP7016793.1 hypothetical protein [Pirellulaceae bacterium]
MTASARTWFVRGFCVGLLILGAVNAASYFFHSADGGNLLKLSMNRREALGFPQVLWEQGNTYGGYYADYGAMFWNGLTGAAIGTALGLAAMRFSHRLNDLVREFEGSEEEPAGRENSFQYSLRGILAATAVAAVLAGVARYATLAELSVPPEILGGLYALGPWFLVALAMAPRRLDWRQRVVIVAPATIALMGSSIIIGGRLANPLAFDEVLLGIFVCWTPQAALGAIGLTTWIVVRHQRSSPRVAR